MKGCGAWGNRRRAAARSPPCWDDAASEREIMAVALTLLALLIEAIVGYPDRLVRAIGHPVTWMGRLIGALDRALNREGLGERTRRAAGGFSVSLLIVAVGSLALALERGLFLIPFGFLGAGLAASTL